MNDNKEIRIVEPSMEHYEAFSTACKKIHSYIHNDSINDPVGKRESAGFIFAQDNFQCRNKDDFKSKIVDYYSEKRELSEKNNLNSDTKTPEMFYFIMSGDEIIGSVSAHPKYRSQIDIDNNLGSFKKWDYLSPTGVRVESSTMLLPEYRGKGFAGIVKKQFFDELRKQGVNEIVATVAADNERSNKAQKKLLNCYGGREYSFSSTNPKTNEVYKFNRYVVNTDTSGDSRKLYTEEQSLSDKINKYRGINKGNSPQQPITKRNPIQKINPMLIRRGNEIVS